MTDRVTVSIVRMRSTVVANDLFPSLHRTCEKMTRQGNRTEIRLKVRV
jgi:hypothetical protein